jgi:hypothetical protein
VTGQPGIDGFLVLASTQRGADMLSSMIVFPV